MMISRYISDKEYECSHCAQLPVGFSYDNICTARQTLFSSFDAIREAWGKPIPISSGYRCSQYNERIGGSRLSAHIFGVALDCYLGNSDEVDGFVNIVETKFPDLRMGIYSDFCHIDVAYLILPSASLHWQKGVRWYE